ncbi:glycoside hydrolase domain-containing protein, partial [Barnesiella intestinihominis]
NEDCGQMSSWYVFSSLGFYPVNPSNGIYVFGRPIFDKVALKLPENKVFEIRTVNNSRENKYIQSVQLNGRPYDKSYISHADIVNGGTLVITMGNKPNKDFGTNMDCRPKSAIK